MNYNEIYQNKEYYRIVKDILRNTEFQRRKQFQHHQDSVYDHSVRVSLLAYKIAFFLSKFMVVSIEDATIGGLLHDFYVTPWRSYKEKRIFRKHGFIHGKIACNNAYQFFPKRMSKRIANSIKCHMFPLTLIPPRYMEGWIITLADKYVSLEVMKNPLELPRYIGVKNIHILNHSKQAIGYTKSIYSFTKDFVSKMY